MCDLLNVSEKPISDDNIINKEYHIYVPYIQFFFKYIDEIKITIQNTDIYLLPSESYKYIYIEGYVTLDNGSANNNVKFRNNIVAHLFVDLALYLI